ncbi:MAG: hypothetical protein GY909_18605 [Oligoflexia bacterium]|nr:hypothetical protein [Oligoflexia bacterium]
MKIKTTIISLTSLLALGTLAKSVEVNIENCKEASKHEKILDSSDFKWNQTPEEIKEREIKLYNSEKRLEKRIFVNDQGKFVLPIDASFGGATEAIIPAHYINSVRAHIETALRRGYVESIIFSDMGHQHFYIPQKYYDEVINPIPVKDKNIRYEKMLANKDLKILYHTAEQLKMVEDKKLLDNRHLQWRFYTRNIVGDNKEQGTLELIHQKDHSHNTAREYDKGYRYWGAGLYISANKNGCFAFKDKEGKTKFFDINLVGINPPSVADNPGDYF